MEKKAWGITIVAAMLLCVPGIFGFLAKQEFLRMVASHKDDYGIEIKQYDLGWFRSKILITHKAGEQGGLDSQWVLYHGPVFFNKTSDARPAYGYGYATGEFILPPLLQNLLASSGNSKKLLSWNVLLSFSHQALGQIQFAGINLPPSPRGRAQIGSVDIQFSLPLDAKDFFTKLTIGPSEISQATRLIRSMGMDIETQRVYSNNAIEQFYFKTQSRGFELEDGKNNLKITRHSLNLNTEPLKKPTALHYVINADALQYETISLHDINLDFLAQFKTAETFNQFYQHLSENKGSFKNPQDLQQIAPQGLSVEIKNIHLEKGPHRFEASGTIQYDTPGTPSNATLSTELRLNGCISKGWMQALLTQMNLDDLNIRHNPNYKPSPFDPDPRPKAEATTKEQIEQLIQKGWLSPKGEDFVFEMVMQHNQLSINGHRLSAQEQHDLSVLLPFTEENTSAPVLEKVSLHLKKTHSA